MNDDFLHRLRQEPPPGFLAELKDKLDRQSTPAQPRRLSFSRGLLVGLLLATTAFAVTSLSINSAPKSLHAFLAAPVEFVARMSSGPSQSEDRQHHGRAPLGPAWLPTHVAPQSQGDALEADPPSASGTAVAVSPVPVEAKSPSTQPAAAPIAYETLDVIATASAYPHAQTVADHFSKNSGLLRLSSDRNGTALNSVCNPDSKGNPSVAELYHRVTPSELRTCGLNLTEFPVGHQAIVLARGRLYGPLLLTSRDLFLALARKVPLPTDPTQLIDNPNTTWNQVNNTLQYDRIHVFGPELSWIQGKFAAALLLEAGCNTYEWLANLRTSDPARYDEICKTVRSDGAYEGSAAGSWTLSDNLVHDPTALGIYTLSEYERSQDRVVANLVDGVEPSTETIVAGTYPASRTLYLYVNRRYPAYSLFHRVLNAYLFVPDFYVYANEPASWGFIALNATERAGLQAALKRYEELKF
jgi:phosphate transport system substrate-binding protein